jgi:hypothetical protein
VAKLLSDAEIQAYRRDGYLCPIDALSSAAAARYRARLEAAEAAAGGSLPGPYRHKPHLVYSWAQALIREPRILDAVEDVIGPDILAFACHHRLREARMAILMRDAAQASRAGHAAPAM